MGLIRELLLKLESLPTPRGAVFSIMPDDPEVSVDGYSGDEIDYHLSLLREAGLIECPGSQPMGGITFSRLSWQGHEFLDTVRNPEIWRETKSGVAKIGGASAEFVWEIAKGYVKHLAKEKLGIDVS
jgi:DNA-binding transcriptional ArsR family regulator